jgi:two-component system sensor histidine kinase PilS (NtrC family)
MIRAVSDSTQHPTPEDWRILRALSFYRLVLVTIQLVLVESGYLSGIFDEFKPRLFYAACVAYAAFAVLLLLPIVYRKPRVEWQAHGQFFVDTAGITTLAYACGGVPSGLGMLMLTTVVGCGMVISTRMALVQAAGVTLVMFAEEFYRLYPVIDTGPITQTGILGLMFFATSVAANAVAQRARKSEALAAQAGSDLASLAQLNESVIEHMQTGVAVIAASGHIRLLNAAAAQMLGARPGQDLRDRAPGLAAALDEWRQGPASAAEGPLAPRPGAEEIVPRFSRLGAGDDAPALVLLDNARALREQALQINLAALGRLSAGIAHEIRNPLSAISHAGQLLAESPELSPENQRLLTMIQRHSERIDKIVKDVLALSRREASTPAPIRLRTWLEQAVARYCEGYPGEARSIRYEAVAADFSMRFDPSHLEQVLFNLWDNSFRHGGADGRRVEIELATGSARDIGAFLEVRDNGPGIRPDLRDRVFEPFFSTAHAGTGLGLYLARELCAYNRARLIYRETPAGACFRLSFTEPVKAAAA